MRAAGGPGAAEAGAVSYATDGGWLSELGLDCAIWGPGSIAVAHKPDEFLPKADLARAPRCWPACGALLRRRGGSERRRRLASRS